MLVTSRSECGVLVLIAGPAGGAPEPIPAPPSAATATAATAVAPSRRESLRDTWFSLVDGNPKASLCNHRLAFAHHAQRLGAVDRAGEQESLPQRAAHPGQQ